MHKIFNNIEDKGWRELLQPLFSSEYGEWLANFIEQAYQVTTTYPEKQYIFRALNETSLSNLKVVIIGQDPYHDGSATGLAFDNDENYDSFTNGVVARPSYSLNNIITAVEKDCNTIKLYPSLDKWAKQGVLLLNTALTVEKGLPESHLKAWEGFTNYLLQALNKEEALAKTRGIHYFLWGKKAQNFKKFINQKYSYIHECGHPAAERYHKGIFLDNCNHFSEANKQILKDNGNAFEIDWSV